MVGTAVVVVGIVVVVVTVVVVVGIVVVVVTVVVDTATDVVVVVPVGGASIAIGSVVRVVVPRLVEAVGGAIMAPSRGGGSVVEEADGARFPKARGIQLTKLNGFDEIWSRSAVGSVDVEETGLSLKRMLSSLMAARVKLEASSCP